MSLYLLLFGSEHLHSFCAWEIEGVCVCVLESYDKLFGRVYNICGILYSYIQINL